MALAWAPSFCASWTWVRLCCLHCYCFCLLHLLLLTCAGAAPCYGQDMQMRQLCPHRDVSGLPAVTIAVPPALPACLAVSVAFAVARLRAQDIFVSSPDKINYAGQIDVVSPLSVNF